MSPLWSRFRSGARLSSSVLNCQQIASVKFEQPCNKMSRFTLADKYKGLEKNVWVEFIQLALEYKPLNLGQGFPDDLVPNYVLDSLSDVSKESVFLNQYTRGFVSLIFS